MATWKKIVTESSDNTIAQDTTGNAATATELAGDITINLTSEVTGSLTNDLTAGETFNIATTVADGVLDVDNFTDASVVTGSEVVTTPSAFLNTANGGNATLATTAAVVEYIDDQGFGAGSGDIGQVRVIAGNGLNITAVGGDTSESPTDTATAASGSFEATLALDLASDGGLEISGGELQANVHANTIQINGSNEIAAVTATVEDNGDNLATGDQIHAFVTSQGYITSSTFTVNPAGGIQVGVNGGGLGTGDVDIATGQTLDISIDSLPNDSLTGDGTTHLGTTQLELGDASGENPTLGGMSAITGITNSGMAVTNLNDLNFAQNADYTIFSAITNKTVTLGGGTNSKIRIAGDLIVSGNTTTIDTSTVQVEDKLITLARSSDSNVSAGTPTFASGGGIELDAAGSIDSVSNPKITWTQSQGASSTPSDGSGLATGLTGWKLRNYLLDNQADHAIAIMDFQSTGANPGGSANSAGVGSFMFDTNGDDLYIRVS